MSTRFEPFQPSRPAPLDQADGLRRLFSAARVVHVPMVHNAFVPWGAAALERLTAAYVRRGLQVFVVDAAETGPAPHQLARIDLAACVDRLSPEVSYLAARGLPMRHVDARGTTAAFLDALAGACPQAEVVLLHAGASDLSRLFAGRAPRPLLLAGGALESLTEAYAGMKLLAQRLGIAEFDLLVGGGASQAPRAGQLAQRLASCGDRFLGASIAGWAAFDPAADEPPAGAPDAVEALALAQLAPEAPAVPLPTPAAAAWRRAAR